MTVPACPHCHRADRMEHGLPWPDDQHYCARCGFTWFNLPAPPTLETR